MLSNGNMTVIFRNALEKKKKAPPRCEIFFIAAGPN